MEKFVFPYINETSIRKTALRKNPIYDQVYTFWSKVIIMELFPYITIIVLNSFIVIKIHESLKFRGRFDRTSNHVEVGDRNRITEETNGLRRDKEIVQLRVIRPRARQVIVFIKLIKKAPFSYLFFEHIFKLQKVHTWNIFLLKWKVEIFNFNLLKLQILNVLKDKYIAL